jgi:hypothetical protein
MNTDPVENILDLDTWSSSAISWLPRSLRVSVTLGNIDSLYFFFSLFFLFIYWGTGAWTQGLHLEPLYQPFFMMGFFEIRSWELFA